MAEWTPGPWKWHRDEYCNEDEYYRLDGPTETPVLDYAGCGTHMIWVEAENARLIAAAPTLLQALKDLLRDTQHYEHHCSDAAWCPVKQARAAIAKAEGKE